MELGISYVSLRKICDEHGFPVTRGGRQFLQRTDFKLVEGVIQSRGEALDKLRRELEERVIELRNQNLSAIEIARHIGHTVPTTRRLCSSLIRAGKLQRLAPARLTESERRGRELKIIRWKRKGYSQSKIAQELGVSQALVSRLCALLVEQGKL